MPKGVTIDLTSTDGFTFKAYHVAAAGVRKGGLMLIQEIFGVTEHIRELADGFAEEGYEVIAPSLYDRSEPGFTADYSAEGIAAARAHAEAVDWDKTTADMQTVVDALKAKGPVFTVGYCWGGTAVWVACCRCAGLTAGSSYYGRLIVDFLDETPRCPIQMHFGESDHTIPLENVETIRAAHPSAEIYVYPAGHGFNSDRRADYDRECAATARSRTLAFFEAAQ